MRKMVLGVYVPQLKGKTDCYTDPRRISVRKMASGQHLGREGGNEAEETAEAAEAEKSFLSTRQQSSSYMKPSPTRVNKAILVF